MTTLLLESATSSPFAALADDEGKPIGAWFPSGKAQELAPLIAQHVDCAALRRVAVGVGPGGFTGLRIGLVLARGLSLALKLPLAGVPTLQIVASGQEASPDGTINACIDGQRGEVYQQTWMKLSTGELVPTGGCVRRARSSADIISTPSPQGFAKLSPHLVFGPPELVLPEYGREPDAVPAGGGLHAL